MRKVGLFEAKQKFSELVDRATRGERIGITRRGKLAAEIGPAHEEVDLKKVFARMDEIRKRGFNVVEEQVDENNAIRLKVRHWDG